MKLGNLMVAFLFFIFLCPFSAKASTEIPFEVFPVVPDTHGEKGYFDFYISDHFTKTIYIEARNLKNRPITLLITPINASTSSYGQISYQVNAKENQFLNLKVPLSQNITYESKIMIPAKSSKKIPLIIHLKNIDNGVVLGGVHVIAENETVGEEEIKQGKTTFQIKNQIAYVIGIKMHTQILVEPKFSFENVKLKLQYREPKLYIEMSNAAPAVIKNLSGKYEVTDEEGNQILKGSFSNMQMAPNSRFQYAADWIDGEVDPGKYQIKLSAEADGKKIDSVKQFTVKGTEPIDEYNKEKKEVDNSIPWWNDFITAAIAGIMFYIIGRRIERKSKKPTTKQ